MVMLYQLGVMAAFFSGVGVDVDGQKLVAGMPTPVLRSILDDRQVFAFWFRKKLDPRIVPYTKVDLIFEITKNRKATIAFRDVWVMEPSGCPRPLPEIENGYVCLVLTPLDMQRVTLLFNNLQELGATFTVRPARKTPPKVKR
jgi:hypothetical protein